MPSERTDMVINKCNKSVQLVRYASSVKGTDFNALVNSYSSFLRKLSIPVNDLNFSPSSTLLQFHT